MISRVEVEGEVIDPQARLVVIRYRAVSSAALNSPCGIRGLLSTVPSSLVGGKAL